MNNPKCPVCKGMTLLDGPRGVRTCYRCNGSGKAPTKLENVSSTNQAPTEGEKRLEPLVDALVADYGDTLDALAEGEKPVNHRKGDTIDPHTLDPQPEADGRRHCDCDPDYICPRYHDKDCKLHPSQPSQTEPKPVEGVGPIEIPIERLPELTRALQAETNAWQEELKEAEATVARLTKRLAEANRLLIKFRRML